MEWQPIETAPKDGSYVLLFCPWVVGGDIFVGNMVPRWGWTPLYYDDTPNFKPTHWMPLPDPPDQASD